MKTLSHLRWALLAAFLAIAGTWLVSGRYQIYASARHWTLSVCTGDVILARNPYQTELEFRRRDLRTLGWTWRVEFSMGRLEDGDLRVPLWELGATSAAAAGASFWAHQRLRRRRADGCSSCGYDRSGLPADAPCPECGKSPAQSIPTEAP